MMLVLNKDKPKLMWKDDKDNKNGDRTMMEAKKKEEEDQRKIDKGENYQFKQIYYNIFKVNIF